MANIKELIQSIESLDSSFDEKLEALNQMEETLVAMRQQEQEAIDENVDLIVEAINVMQKKVDAQLVEIQGMIPEKGDKGDKGLDGKQGKDGRDGKDGKDGINGKDGADGKDGVSVTDAKIDFDGSLVITLSTGQEINVGEVVAPELQEKIKLVTSGGAGTVLPSQTGNANKYLKTDGTNLSWSTVSGGGSGTVTSVAASGGTGISVSGSPITTSGTLTITNTAPDQTVVLTAGTGISTSGTYPNFTITNTSPSSGGTVTSVSGTGTVNGLSLSGTVTSSGNLTFGGTLDLSSPPAIGGTAASTGRFTTVTSTIATGTAPFTVASTTPVSNLSIGGNAGTVTNGVYTTDTGTVTNTMLAGSIANAKLTNSSITFGSTTQALGSTVSAISGVTIDNGAIGGTTAAAGTFTTLIGGSGSANYEQITGGATGKAVQFQSLGSDAAVSLAIQSKGTGAIDLAAGSSGVNISNGGTVTALTRTAAGSAYTTNPTPSITAPTTAGGVQATATCTIGVITAVVSAGGSGYLVGDVLTISGGTSTTAATVTVATLSGSAVATVTISNVGAYTASPSNPASTTGGTGTGATFTLGFGINTTFTITAAGSGYVEQPTVTFSGGGGSGAAAYASVGGGTIIRALGSTGLQSLDFYTPSGINTGIPNFRIRDTAGDSYWTSSNQSGSAILQSSNSSMFIANSTGVLDFKTGGGNQYNQLRVSNTTSAVNYVQVTGGATGNPATVTASAQGSDANVNMRLTPKGTGTLLTATAATILDGTAIPAGGTAGAGYKLSSTANFGIFFGSGAPTLSAAKGSIYMRSDGSSIATRMYINTDGSTTWTNVVTAA